MLRQIYHIRDSVPRCSINIPPIGFPRKLEGPTNARRTTEGSPKMRIGSIGKRPFISIAPLSFNSFGAELGFALSIHAVGRTKFVQIDRSAGHSAIPGR
jgi:hypothetical protein